MQVLLANSAYSQVHVAVNFETDYPGYSYYAYPKWNGHYQDRARIWNIITPDLKESTAPTFMEGF